MLSTASQGSWAALLVLVLLRDENNLIIQNQKEKKKKLQSFHIALICSALLVVYTNKRKLIWNINVPNQL